MRKVILSLIVLLALVGGAIFISANNEGKVAADLKVVGQIPVLGMSDLEGEPLMFGDARLKGQRIVFCFLTTWSLPSVEQTKEVLATIEAARQAQAFDGTLVLVCDGADVDTKPIGSRRLRQEIDPNWQTNGNVWVTPEKSPKVDLGNAAGNLSSLDNKFKDAFSDLSKLDRVPALAISDPAGRVSYAKHGRLTLEEIQEQLGVK